MYNSFDNKMYCLMLTVKSLRQTQKIHKPKFTNVSSHFNLKKCIATLVVDTIISLTIYNPQK